MSFVDLKHITINLLTWTKGIRRFPALCKTIIVLLASSPVAAYEITATRMGDSDGKTRIVVESTAKAKYNVFTLSNPERVIIDFKGGQFSPNYKRPSLTGASIVKTGHGNPKKGVSRIVFYTPSKPEEVNHFLIPQNNGKPHRVVVDIKRKQRKHTLDTVAGSQTRKVLVAIDAGHGGKDPGAIGPNGLLEKEIVLSIAKQLALEIDRTPGFKSLLIRNNDTFLELHQRREIARKNRADLFVSIHADAFTKPQANGASVYMISSKSATSAMARYLAKNSNGSIAGVSLKNRDPMVSKILSSMSLEGSMQASKSIGEMILPELSQVARLHSRHVEKAPFAVLKSPDVPSLLIETGFISNPKESAKLATSWYRAKIARAIHRGIVNYFNEAPPVDSWLYAHRNNDGSKNATKVAKKAPSRRPAEERAKPIPTQKYIVQPGDTLSEIAALYAMSTQDLKEINKLSNSRIKVGQSLLVPSTGIGSMDYIVKPGDTVSEIAFRFGVSSRKLAKHNNLRNGKIRVGQHLDIPVDEPIEYVVRRGDTLSKIALQFDVDLADIKRFNAISTEIIRLGQKLKIPVSS